MEHEKMNANLDPSVQIEKRTKDFYHVKIVVNHPIDMAGAKVEEKTEIQQFDKRGWENFEKNHGSVYGDFLKEIKLIHDPSIQEKKAKKEPEPEPDETEKK